MKYVLTALFLILGACAKDSSSNNDSLIGQHVNVVASEFGAPTSVETVPGGRRYTFTKVMGGALINVSPAENYRPKYSIIVTTNNSDIIVDVN